MDKKFIEILETALMGFIEDLIQSDTGPSEEDIAYIEAERKYIKILKAAV